MFAGRARVLSATIVGLGLLIPISVVPAAAATCALSAPATVTIGTQLAIRGSGFPGSSSIDISIGLEGATPDQFAVQSDGAGAFSITLSPEPADAGRTTVVATAGATCSAQAVYTVTSASSTPAPTSAASVAPGGSAAGATPNPPRTDAARAGAGQGTDGSAIRWTLLLLILVVGVLGLLTTRRATSR